MAKFEKRLEAFRLRRQGWSINAIASQLAVSKSSASEWCSDLQLTEPQRKRLAENAIRESHRGRMIGAQRNRDKKQQQIEFYKQLGKQDIGRLTDRDWLIAGVALYWAEGTKKSRFGFTNSEPQMIAFMAHWLKRALGIKKEEFMPRIFINAIHEPRITKVLNFWSELLQIPAHQFGKPVFLRDRPKKIYENHDNYYGVLALGVRNSTKIKYRVLGLIDAIRDQKVPV